MSCFYLIRAALGFGSDTETTFRILSAAIKDGKVPPLTENDVAMRNRQGNTLLGVASYYGNTGAARALLAEGADPNARQEGDATPLTIAAWHEHHGIVHILLQNGARPNLVYGRALPALHCAVNRNNRDELQMLLDIRDINPNLACADGYTPLAMAFATSALECAKMLIAAGAKPRLALYAIPSLQVAQFATEWIPGDASALISAARRGDDECVVYLVQNGAAVNDLFEDTTPLVAAVQSWHEDIVAYLLDEGSAHADMVVGSMRRTALMFAAMQGNLRMIQLLLEAGASNLYDVKGRSAVDYILRRHQSVDREQCLAVLNAVFVQREPPPKATGIKIPLMTLCGERVECHASILERVPGLTTVCVALAKSQLQTLVAFLTTAELHFESVVDARRLARATYAVWRTPRGTLPSEALHFRRAALRFNEF